MAQQKNEGYFDAYVDVSRLPEGIGGADLAKSVADLPGLRFVIPQTISKRLKLLFDTRKNRDSACQKTFGLPSNDYVFRLRNGQPPWVYRTLTVQGWPLNVQLDRLDEFLQQFGERVEAPTWSTWPETDVPDGKVTMKLKCPRDRTVPTVIEYRLDPSGNPIKLRLSYRGQPIQCFNCMEFGHLGKQCPNSQFKEPQPILDNSIATTAPIIRSVLLDEVSKTADGVVEQELSASQHEDANSTSDFWSNDSATSPEQSPRTEACPLEQQNAINLQQQIRNIQDQTFTATAQFQAVPCKLEPTFETCDINDDRFGKRLSISPGRRSSTPVQGKTVRVQIRHISCSDVRDRMCADCYMVELRRLQSGEEGVPAEYWICCHGWNSDPELCNCYKSREAVWDHHWLFCTCKEPTEYRCCHGTDPPCWACLAVDGTFHEAETIEQAEGT